MRQIFYKCRSDSQYEMTKNNKKQQNLENEKAYWKGKRYEQQFKQKR